MSSPEDKSNNIEFSAEGLLDLSGKKFHYTGVAAGVHETAGVYVNQANFRLANGHGWAAEQMNHLYDRLHLRDATIVGGNNAKNGPDRIVNGVEIQTKFCQSASETISSTFKDGTYRYYDANGKPMAVEVPKDQYDAALIAMRKKIESGQVPGVSDPDKATELVKESPFTYKQARQVAKAGTVESLTFDAINGLKVGAIAGGITFALTYATEIWNGASQKDALKVAAIEGLKVGGMSFITSVVSAQIGRTIVDRGLSGILKMIPRRSFTLSTVDAISGTSSRSLSNASKVIRSNLVACVVATAVQTAPDAYHAAKGNASWKQAGKRFLNNAASVGGGSLGWIGGAAAAGLVASTAWVTVPAALIGSFAVGYASSTGAKYGLDKLIDDDAKAMAEHVDHMFNLLATREILKQAEVDQIVEAIDPKGMAKLLFDLYASNRRKVLCYQFLKPYVDDAVMRRVQIALPSPETILNNFPSDEELSRVASGEPLNEGQYEQAGTAAVEAASEAIGVQHNTLQNGEATLDFEPSMGQKIKAATKMALPHWLR